MRGQPLVHASNLRSQIIRVKRHHAYRFVRTFGELPCSKASIGKFAEVEDQRGVAVADIAAGALAVILRFGFAQPITRIEHTVFSAATEWAPATVRDVARDCEIQRRAIGTRLPAGDDGDSNSQLNIAVTGLVLNNTRFGTASLVMWWPPSLLLGRYPFANSAT